MYFEFFFSHFSLVFNLFKYKKEKEKNVPVAKYTGIKDIFFENKF